MKEFLAMATAKRKASQRADIILMNHYSPYKLKKTNKK